MKKLSDLTPIQFESLIFDIMNARGLKNVTWRTPGADGGRDIEAEEISIDVSGYSHTNRWFVECKKYKGSVDWPTIYGKVSYAEANQANYLLMCTTSKYTPSAITHVDKWNSSNRLLKIRLWAGHEIENQLQGSPDIQAKYGLTNAPLAPGKSLVNLALALSNSVATHYGESVFSGLAISGMLEASQAFSELLKQRISDVSREHSISPILRSLEPEDMWSVSGEKFLMDTVSLRAFLVYIYALSKKKLHVKGCGRSSCLIDADSETNDLVARYADTFGAICLWGDLEYEISDGFIKISQRIY
ncbi:TPA: restriction endonuclease [Pseudomonas aeruginosa]|uniref:restriction endonuclease n=1 Tax=Pseudomonas aeruginosa TaxID=287 RepID=UPI00106CD0EA|nr:restriction endonuclease [Pseudomonas aeruginosa]